MPFSVSRLHLQVMPVPAGKLKANERRAGASLGAEEMRTEDKE